MKPHHGCPVQATINLISGKWKVAILWHLSFGTKRFAEIRDLLPGLSEKVLTEQLRQLEADQLIGREVTPTSPPRVDYFLTGAGQSLIPLLDELCHWGTEHLGVQPTLPRMGRASA